MYNQLLIDKLVKAELERCEVLYNELRGIYETLPKGSLIARKGHIYHAYREI